MLEAAKFDDPHQTHAVICTGARMAVLGDSIKECTCSEAMVSRYQKRISGPLLDRIDIHVEVPRVQYEKLSDERVGESSTRIRERVEAARAVQQRRFQGTKLTCNAEMGLAQVREYCKVEPAGQGLLKAAMNQLHLSAEIRSRKAPGSAVVGYCRGARPPYPLRLWPSAVADSRFAPHLTGEL